MDLSTEYLGLKLANPLVPSASPLSRDVDSARRLEDAGASAIVMYSLFEEEVERSEEVINAFLHHQDLGHAEAGSYAPELPEYASLADEYLGQIFALKQALDIPVIASLNGVTSGGWIEYGRMLEESGADALELNLYQVAATSEESGAQVEQRYIEILNQLIQQVSLPITVKLSPYFSSLANFARQLKLAGASGLSLFNRFYQPDIDLEELNIIPTLKLSTPNELLLRTHWIALLHGRVKMSLAATGGIHSAEDVLKVMMAGADIAHLCSALLKKGPDHLEQILKDLGTWLETHEYESIEQLKGSMSHQHAPDPSAFERANYLQVLQHNRKKLLGEWD